MTRLEQRQSRVARLLDVRATALDRGRRAHEANVKADELLDEDHPLARAFGAKRAAEMLEGIANERQAVARDRRQEVERLSREGLKVREIADRLGLHHNYVVQLRASLGVGRRR